MAATEIEGRLIAMSGIHPAINDDARKLLNNAASGLAAARILLKAIDDMHSRGETFTARVSLAAYALRKELEK